MTEIATVEAANVFLRDVYIPAHNARFAVAAEQEGSAFVAIPGVDLAEILCVQEERQVGNDNCVSFNRLKLQIPASPLRAHFVKARVKVRQYPDGTHAIFYGPRCLGRYDKKEAFCRAFARRRKWSLESARRPACGNVDKANALTTVPQENKNRSSGLLMCYQNRPS